MDVTSMCAVEEDEEAIWSPRRMDGHIEEGRTTCYCLLCRRGTPPCLRGKNPSWVVITRVIFYVLHQYTPNAAYLNMKQHIYPYVDVHWRALNVDKKVPNLDDTRMWRMNILNALSHARNLFQSGKLVFKQKGLWKLIEQQDPWTLPSPSSQHYMQLDASLRSSSSVYHKPTMMEPDNLIMENDPQQGRDILDENEEEMEYQQQPHPPQHIPTDSNYKFSINYITLPS